MQFKLLKLSSVAIILCSTSLVAQKTLTPSPSLSREQLIEKRKAALEAKAEEPKPIDIPKKPGLLAISTILYDNRYWTIVPKKSVFLIPDNLKSKVIKTPTGKFLSWQKFLARNGSWLHAHPVSFDKAQGKEQLDLNKFKKLNTLNKLVVATLRKGPIAVSEKAIPELEK